MTELDVSPHEGTEGVHPVEYTATVDVDADVKSPGPVLPGHDERCR